MDNARPEIAARTAAVRLVLTPEAVEGFARLQEQQKIASLPPAPPHKSAGLGGWMKDAAQSVIP